MPIAMHRVAFKQEGTPGMSKMGLLQGTVQLPEGTQHEEGARHV